VAYEYITDTLATTWASLQSVCQGLTPEEWRTATACPGWCVQDVLSHLVGFELLLAGAPVPDGVGEDPPHVKNDIGRMNERFVDERRMRTGDEVLAEFVTVSAMALASLRARSDEEWTAEGWSPEGTVPYARFMETRILDSWIHLQDIRDALLRPGDDHGYGEEIVVNRFEGYLPYVWGKRAAAPEGSRLRLSLEGPLARSVDIVVHDGRAGVASTTGTPDLDIVTSATTFWRRGAGRISPEAFLSAHDTHVAGDAAMARHFAEALAVMI
jgi:uncharacterized protein (TIGR03083 family)